MQKKPKWLTVQICQNFHYILTVIHSWIQPVFLCKHRENKMEQTKHHSAKPPKWLKKKTQKTLLLVFNNNIKRSTCNVFGKSKLFVLTHVSILHVCGGLHSCNNFLYGLHYCFKTSHSKFNYISWTIHIIRYLHHFRQLCSIW